MCKPGCWPRVSVSVVSACTRTRGHVSVYSFGDIIQGAGKGSTTVRIGRAAEVSALHRVG